MLSTRRNFFLIALITALFFSIRGVTQQIENLPLYRQFNISTWTMDDGIPANIQTIAQTSDGFLWIGTDEGLIQFDGLSFVPMAPDSLKELPHECTSLCITGDQSLIYGFADGKVLGYQHGIYRFIGDEKIFNGFIVSAILVDSDSSFWIGLQGGGLIRVNNDVFSEISVTDGLPSNYVTSLQRDSEDDLWIGTQEGLCRLRDGKVEQVFKENGLSNDFILSLYFDSQATLWIGTHGGLNRFEKGIIQTVSDSILPRDADIHCIAEDRSGNIWFGANGDGLFRITRNTSKMEKISDTEGLPSNLIRSLLIDMESNIWVGLQGNFGLCQLQQPVVETYTTEEGLSGDNIMAILQVGKSGAWVGNATGGLDLFMDGRFSQYDSILKLGNNPIFSLALDRNQNLWIGTKGNPVILKEFKTIEEASLTTSNDIVVHAIYLANDGSLWIGTDKGICVLRGDSVETITSKNGLSNEQIFCFYEDTKGMMWIGTQYGGINTVKNGEINQFKSSNGLTDNMILCFMEDPAGYMWVGTAAGGLNRIEVATGQIQSFGLREGLDYSITQIFEDQFGYLWLGGNLGIFTLPKGQFDELIAGYREKLDPQIFTFTDKEKTMSLNGGIFPAGCQFADGTMWFPTNHGIAVISPERTHGETIFPQAIIQWVEVNNVLQPIASAYHLPPAVIHLEIKFTAPAFISPKQIKFRFKLAGYDTDWEYAGEDRKAHYTKVPHGSYTFQVQVSNHLGQWSDQIISIPIKIKPYFYQRIWFLILCGAVGLFILYAIYKYRIRQVREKELEILVDARTKELQELNRELDQRVLDRTAELAASNQELEAFTYSVSHDLRAPVRRIEGLVAALTEDYATQLDETGKDFLNKVADSSVEMGQLIEEFLKLARIARQEIDKTELNLSQLVTEITEELANADPGRKVSVKIEPDILVKGDSHLIRIALQNILNNAWKYTGKKEHPEVIFGCREKDGLKVFFIQDNGVGFDMNYYDKLFTPFLRLHSDDLFTGTGIGLATVKRIITKHGGKIWAQAEPEKGSTFFFTL
ncbi:MAG: hypothetical protein ISS17_10615 [Bacteroidales bacterium]|nr:hypothetical protein [Bacteroidales bacterium]